MKSNRKVIPAADNAPDFESEYLKANGAARFLNVSRRTFDRMRKVGQIPYVRCGGGRVLRYRRADLIRAMDALTVR
jgi:excisionase family DNA binding protein